MSRTLFVIIVASFYFQGLRADKPDEKNRSSFEIVEDIKDIIQKLVIARAEEIASRNIEQGAGAGEYGMGEPVPGRESQDVAQKVGDQVITSMGKVVKALEDGVNNQDPRTVDGALFTNDQPGNNGEVVPEKKDDASNRKQFTKTGNGNNEGSKKEFAGESNKEGKGIFASLGVYCAGAVSQVTAVAAAHPYWVAATTGAVVIAAVWTAYKFKYSAHRKKKCSKTLTLQEELQAFECAL